MNKIVTKKKKRLGIFNTILLAVLITYSAALILLVVWGLITSVKTLDDFFGNKFLLPTGNITEWGWDNYAYVLSNFSVKMRKAGVGVISINMFGQLVNTLIYTFGSAFCVTACTCIVAYLSAKFNYLCSKIVYTLVLIVMTIPIVGNTPSMLLFLHQTNLYDNWLGMILMNFHFGGVYFLVFYGIYSGISSEYEEAATIDGANEYQIFFLIMIPLISTTFYTVFLINFISAWNDYNTALMYMPTHPTLAYGVYHLSVTNEPGMSYAPMRMVACVILALPVTALFVYYRNKIIGNTMAGGVKE